MSDLMCRTGEQVKFKFFTMQISFQISCFRGGETISNAEVFSPASSTSLAGADSKKRNYKHELLANK